MPVAVGVGRDRSGPGLADPGRPVPATPEVARHPAVDPDREPRQRAEHRSEECRLSEEHRLRLDHLATTFPVQLGRRCRPGHSDPVGVRRGEVPPLVG